MDASEKRERYRGERVPDVDRARRFLRLKSSQIEHIIDRAMAPTTCVDCKKITKGYARCYDCNSLKRARDSASADGGGRRPAPRRDDDRKFKSAGGGVVATASRNTFLQHCPTVRSTLRRLIECSNRWDGSHVRRTILGVGEHESGSEKRRPNHTAMSGVPYVKFEERVLRVEPALRRALSELSAPMQATPTQTPTSTQMQTTNDAVERRVESECRARAEGARFSERRKYKTRDGHYVRVAERC